MVKVLMFDDFSDFSFGNFARESHLVDWKEVWMCRRQTSLRLAKLDYLVRHSDSKFQLTKKKS